MKSACLLSHRPGTTRQAFREYYETRHARLGSKYFPFAKYVRNHVVESSIDVNFDVVTEFYFAEGADLAGLLTGPVRDIMNADEREFMDQSLLRSVAVEESILSGPPRDVAAPGTRRQMLLLNSPEAPDEAFHSAVRDWGLSLASHAEVTRVSVDRAHALGLPGHAPFPYQGILSLWLDQAGEAIAKLEPPAGVRLDVSLRVDVCESPPELLEELYDPEGS